MTHEWARLGRPPRAVSVGAYIVDVLGRTIEELPKGQRSRLIEEITMTVAGTAGAVSVNLARLGVETSAVGVIGVDALGDFLLHELHRRGVDTTGIRRVEHVQTSATILAIDRNGDRPAFHVIGANGALGSADTDWIDLSPFDALHLGGVSALPGLDGAPAVDLLRRARELGLYVSMDMLGIKRDDAAELVAEYLPYVSLFSPNDLEACALTGCDDPVDAARELRRWGAEAVAVTRGAEGAVLCNADGIERLPAYETRVVDTTGCGDAFTSGTVVGHFLGYDDARALQMGIAAATLNAEGLGSAASSLTIEELSDVSASRAVL